MGCSAVVALVLFAGSPDPVVGSLESLLHRSTSEMALVVDRWSADRRSLSRRYPVSASPQRRDRMREFARAWRDRLRELDFEGMSLDAKVDYVLLDNELRANLDQLDRETMQAAESESRMPFALPTLMIVEARMDCEAIDPQQAADSLVKIHKQVEAARKTVGKERVLSKREKLAAARTADATDEMRQALSAWFRHYDGYDPMFSWWNRDPQKKLDSAMQSYAKALREQEAGVKEGDDETIVGEPIGREGLLDDLRNEMIPYSPEELLQIADREFQWCEREMLRASRDMGFGDDWKKALEKVKTLHVEPGQQPQLVRDLAKEASDFVENHDLVTVPPLAREDWPLEMMTPTAQKRNPFFLGGDRIIVSFPTDGMEHADKQMSMRANNIHFSRATVFHELIPGHHLQQFMNARYNTHRRPFGTPFWTEGWALYWEMLLWDKGFPLSAENRVGMLFWRMHRCARIVFSLKFHLGEMTPEQAIDYLVDRVGHERFSAEGEVRRSFAGGYSPLYQAAYMLGGLQFRALHAESVGPGKLSDLAFHDQILQGNGMPVEMVRVLISGNPPVRDFAPVWRFADPLK